MRDRISKFIQGIDAEIAFLEKDEGDRTYDLVSGQRDERSTGPAGIYIFVLTDPLRLPEDAGGSLRFGDREVQAMVVAQEGNRLWLMLEAAEPTPPFIPQARLIVSETDLLKRLRERLAEMHEFGMAPKVFGDEPARVSWTPLSSNIDLGPQSESFKHALDQIFGSEVTYLWGPPGTGKTFSIAAMVAASVTENRSVLVTSHTHAAVEQALWASVEPPRDGRAGGPLFGSPLVEDGKILKIGPLKQAKIPAECHLDSYLEARAREQQEQIARKHVDLRSLDERLERFDDQLRPWRALDVAHENAEKGDRARAAAEADLQDAQRAVVDAAAALRQAREGMERAQSSFLVGRKGRVSKAQASVAETAARVKEAETKAMGATELAEQARLRSEESRERRDESLRAVPRYPPREELEERQQEIVALRAEIERDLAELQQAGADVANQLLDEARAVFCTLTKLYMDPKLRERHWDVVIIDEASMAMPPLVAIAAARASRSVAIVGDFYQLPPVVRSRDDIVTEQLGRDVFEILQIPRLVEEGHDPPQLASLSVQRRMHPYIADVARTLVYKDRLEDHPEARGRTVPEWIGAVGSSDPLVIVDIGELRPWAGRVPGTLSRYNPYSAQASVELAALCAARMDEPAADDAPQIGIVTPYAAQRRYLARLVETLGLERWVVAGTVHTFQGSECDLIIFDSVLGEPQWTARLTDPHQFSEVRRDLNVAVTRARHQFVFVGDASWMDKRARPGSGYGALWSHLDAVAARLNVTDVLGSSFRERLVAGSAAVRSWELTANPKRSVLLDEVAFYPAFVSDLAAAREEVVLFTPFIGKTRWPAIEPHIAALPAHGVRVILVHKPLTDPEWRQGDPAFGRQVFASLSAAGVKLIPASGVHAKTIVIDGHIVYEGSLNWASQTASYEHMWRFESPEMAKLVERMLQVRSVLSTVDADEGGGHALTCPKCDGPLILVNQARLNASRGDQQPLKWACARHAEDKASCDGYMRRVDARAPFRAVPTCSKGEVMGLSLTKAGRPWQWKCSHASCRHPRFVAGDVLPHP